MTLKPLKDRIVAVVEKPLEKTKSGILLGEAKEKPAYAVVESVVIKLCTRNIPRLRLRWRKKIILL